MSIHRLTIPTRSPRLTRRQVLASSAAIALPAQSLAAQAPEASPIASPVASGPQLIVYPSEVHFDETFDVTVTGLQAYQEVVISSSFTDAAGSEWGAEGTFIADANGTVYLAAQKPAAGTWNVPDAMGLIWSALSGTSARYQPSYGSSELVDITTKVDGGTIGTTTITRIRGSLEHDPVIINGPELVAEYYSPAPDSPTPAPAVIVLGGSEGGIATQMAATLLASHGYATLAVGYFGIGDLHPTLDNIPLEYFANAIAWLQDQPGVDASRLGVLGYSRGGELALLLGVYYPEISAVVNLSGGGYVAGGWSGTLNQDPADIQPAWTWKGEGLPFQRQATEDPSQFEIPVERINGPVLLVRGDTDQVLSSNHLIQVAADRLDRNHHPWPVQFLRYPGAGHYFGVPYMPMTARLRMYGLDISGDPLSDQIASVNSWRAILNMLDWRLKQGTPT